jgi:hypothetical protein
MGEMRNAYHKETERKRPLGRPKRRWKDVSRLGLREM